MLNIEDFYTEKIISAGSDIQIICHSPNKNEERSRLMIYRIINGRFELILDNFFNLSVDSLIDHFIEYLIAKINNMDRLLVDNIYLGLYNNRVANVYKMNRNPNRMFGV